MVYTAFIRFVLRVDSTHTIFSELETELLFINNEVASSVSFISFVSFATIFFRQNTCCIRCSNKSEYSCRKESSECRLSSCVNISFNCSNSREKRANDDVRNSFRLSDRDNLATRLSISHTLLPRGGRNGSRLQHTRYYIIIECS